MFLDQNEKKKQQQIKLKSILDIEAYHIEVYLKNVLSFNAKNIQRNWQNIASFLDVLISGHRAGSDQSRTPRH